MSSIGTPARARSLREHLPRLLAVIGILLLVGLLAYGLASKATNDSVDQSLANGTAPLAPSFDDPVLDLGNLPKALNGSVEPALADGQLSLNELKGTPFVLNFWASWCIPCREEAPVLREGWERYGPEGVLFLGLNMQDLTGDARKFIDQYEVTYPTIREPSNDTARAYGVTGIPETFFISAKGRIVAHVIGVVSKQQLAQGALAAKRARLIGVENGGARRPQR
jgi:cytochrome c biogenesis protein CcmG, thiol:disulfide interchange protein DsbE